MTQYRVVTQLPRRCRIEEVVPAISKAHAIAQELQSLFDRGFNWTELRQVSARRIRQERAA